MSASKWVEYIHLDAESGLLTWKKTTTNRVKVGAEAFAGLSTTGYLRGRFGGRHISSHRLVFLIFNGWVCDEVDHINGNRTDNRPCNLRSSDKQTNSYNSKAKNPLSGLKGAHSHKASGRWTAQICYDGKAHYLGIFPTAQEAHEAYRIAAREHHGDFARLE